MEHVSKPIHATTPEFVVLDHLRVPTLNSGMETLDSLSLCWRGMAGTGKRKILHEYLRQIAEMRGFPFSIKMKSLEPRGEGSSENVSEETAASTDLGTQFTFEYSLVHMGYDVARMSMQDKHILRPVLTKLGQGSQVMAGKQGRASRIIVLYHAHLLSTESLLLIQACLEHNNGDLNVWMTSELPVPLRIRDWFVEIPVAVKPSPGPPVTWNMVFTRLIDKWQAAGPPLLADVKQVKGFVYEMLMRNLRWVEATHFLLDVILLHPRITADQRLRAVAALAACEATSGGYTIPSYRIPVLWESLFLELRTIFSGQTLDGTTTSSTRTQRPRKKGVVATAATVDTVQTDR